MEKRIIGSDIGAYAFDKTAKTVTITGVASFLASRVLSITNVTRSALIYVAEGDSTLGGTWSSNVVTLDYDTSTHANGDELRILYAVPEAVGRGSAATSESVALSTEDAALLSELAESHVGGLTDPENGVARDVVGNVSEKMKDGFDTINVTNWDIVTASGDAVLAEGNVAASNYNVISKGVSPAINTSTTSSLTSKDAFNIPHDVMAGMTLSVRMQGQEFAMETVGVDSNGAIVSETPASPQSIQGNVTVASNVATINFNDGHGFLAGDTVILYGNAYSPLNVGPVVLTSVVLQPNRFTVPCTAANGTYTAGGSAIRKCPCGWAEQHAGIRFVGATAGNADAVSESGQRPMVNNWNPGNTQDVALYPTENGINYTSMPYTVALRPKGEWIIQRATEYSQFTVADQDSTTPFRSSNIPRRQNNASQKNKYKIRFRAENFENLTKPVGAITAISKSASTTATITCPNHGLTANDFVAYFGVRDKTNFADVGTIQVASIVNSNQVTVVGGASATATSYGGFLVRVNGNQNLTAQAISVQSYQKTTDGARLLLIGSGTWTPGYGTIHTLYGLVDSTNTRITALEGRYRVAAISTTSIELVPLDSQDLTSVSTSPVNAGGTLIANSDFRLHYAKLLSYARLMVESRRATGDRNRAFGVEVLNTPAVSGTVTASNTAGTAAQGATASGNPVFVGSVAKTAQPTARTDGQMVAPVLDKLGRTVMVMGHIRDLVDLNAPVTLSTTTETTVVAAIASVFNDVVEVNIDNTSATAVRVYFRTVAAGAVVRSVWVEGGKRESIILSVPWKQATVNTAWTAQLSAAVTDVRVSLGTIRNV